MYPKELVQKIHQSLPPELLEPIASETVLGTIEEIAIKKDLSVEQMKKLERILSFRLMGLVTQEKFSENIQKELGVNSDIATTIADELNKKVLSNLPSDLLKKQEDKVKKEFLNKATQAPNAPIHGPTSEKERLPMIEPGEVAHTVDSKQYIVNSEKKEEPKPQGATPIPPPPPAPQTAAGPVKLRPHSDTRPEKPASPTPDYRYPGGADPYREPIQ